MSVCENLYHEDGEFVAQAQEFKPHRFMRKQEGDKRTPSIAVRSVRGKPQRMPGVSVIMMEPSDTWHMLEHYFHLCEHLAACWNAYKETGGDSGEDVKNVLLLGYEKPRLMWEGVNDINRHLMRALFPNAQVLTFDLFRKLADGKTLRFDKAIVSDRGVTTGSKLNKMLGASIPEIDPEHLHEMSDIVHGQMGTSDEPNDKPVVTYIERDPPRTLTEDTREKLKQTVEQQGCKFNPVDFAALSYPHQLQTIRNTDVLVGVHGNGLTHTLFLKPGATVIELFPSGCHLLDYRVFADLKGLRYYGMSPDGIYSKHQAYRVAEQGDLDHPVDDLPWKALEAVIHESVSTYED